MQKNSLKALLLVSAMALTTVGQTATVHAKPQVTQKVTKSGTSTPGTLGKSQKPSKHKLSKSAAPRPADPALAKEAKSRAYLAILPGVVGVAGYAAIGASAELANEPWAYVAATVVYFGGLVTSMMGIVKAAEIVGEKADALDKKAGV